MAAPLYTEIIPARRWREFLKNGKWRGIRENIVPTGDLGTQLPLLRAQTFTVNGFTLLPRYLDVDYKTPIAPDKTLVKQIYQFADNPAAYTINKARLSISAYGVEFRVPYAIKTAPGGGWEYDLTKPVETQPDKDGIFYKPVIPGSNKLLRPEAKMLLRTALPQASVNWDQAYASIGTVNAPDKPLVVSGNTIAKGGELLLLNVGIPEYFIWDSDDAIVPVRYEFLFRKGGFNPVEVEEFQLTPIRLPVYHRDDDPKKWADSLDDPPIVPRKFLINDGTEASTNGIGAELADPPGDCKFRTAVRQRPTGIRATQSIFPTSTFDWIFTLAEW